MKGKDKAATLEAVIADAPLGTLSLPTITLTDLMDLAPGLTTLQLAALATASASIGSDASPANLKIAQLGTVTGSDLRIAGSARSLTAGPVSNSTVTLTGSLAALTLASSAGSLLRAGGSIPTATVKGAFAASTLSAGKVTARFWTRSTLAAGLPLGATTTNKLADFARGSSLRSLTAKDRAPDPAAWVGWRGRRVGEYPHCRDCGFDLAGTSRETDRCSECGADIRAPTLRTRGLRQRRRGYFVAAGVLAGVAGECLVASVRESLRPVDWQPIRPVWILRQEVGSADQARAVGAGKELLRGIDSGGPSGGQAEGIAKVVVRRQARAGTRWDLAFGDVVEAARAKGLVTDSLRSEHARHAPLLALETRQVSRSGDPIPYAVIL